MSFGAELPEAASVAAVHESALRVLERTGVLVQDDEAVELLRSRGARCDGRRVFLDEDLVQRALATAPSSFVLAGRRPELGLPLGGADGRVFGSGSGAAYMLEGRTMRPGTLADLEATAKLGHQLPAIDFNSDCMEPLDLPEAVRTRRGTHARLVASDKAIEWVASVDEDVDEGERINEILFGAEWHARPRALIVLNTTAPLLISGETARILLRWARLGQPVCMTSCVMGGTTGPATIAGVLAVQHAEVLATLVLGQAAREGSPFVYGGLPVMASLRTGAAQFGAPEFSRLAVATAQLAHLCGLPVRAGAAATDAHAVDGRAMAESAAGLSAAVFAGAHFLFQAAGMLSSFNALSLEKYVLDADLISGAACGRRSRPRRRGRPRRGRHRRGRPRRRVPRAGAHAPPRARLRAPGPAAAGALRALGRGGRRGRRRRRRPPRPGAPRRARAAGRPRRGHAAAARRVLSA